MRQFSPVDSEEATELNKNVVAHLCQNLPHMTHLNCPNQSDKHLRHVTALDASRYSSRPAHTPRFLM